MDYKSKINKIASEISKDIIDLERERRRGNPPTQAFSDFLTHNEQGNWAEELMFSSLNNLSLPIYPVMYGKADKIMAGDLGFKEFYNSYQKELSTIGKRPDILLFDKNAKDIIEKSDISGLSLEELSKIVPKAKAGLEVRSSAYLTSKFNPKEKMPSLSFTPKVEDLIVILKWINNYGVPHYYVQVFFDAIYAISFQTILTLIRDARLEIKGIKNKRIFGYLGEQLKFVIEKNPKNQYKETIHVFLNSGIRIDEKLNMPKLRALRKELASGRLLHYVAFESSVARLDKKSLINLMQS